MSDAYVGKHRLDEAQKLARHYWVPHCTVQKNGLKYWKRRNNGVWRPELKPLQGVAR